MSPKNRAKLLDRVGFGCFVAPIVLVVGWVIYAVVAWTLFPHAPTAEQAACSRQGRTCDEDGYPVGMSDDAKRALDALDESRK